MISLMDERHRIDAWLKLVCLFKHRVDATDACKGGHVKLNGQRAKPAAPVREGDVIEYLGGDDRYHRVIVQGLPGGTISTQVARTMYIDETPKPEPDPMRSALRDRGAGRPTKRERRDMEKLRR
jgi:ribosome-associated heat shock protein Hsp15